MPWRWWHQSAAAGAAAVFLLVAVTCLTQPDVGARSQADELSQDVNTDAKLRQISGLISEVSAVKHALLSLENREPVQRLLAEERRLSDAGRGHAQTDALMDSFDYGAQVGHQPLMTGEWSERNPHDVHLNMVPDRELLHKINEKVKASECVFPDCVTRSGLPPGSVLYPGNAVEVRDGHVQRKEEREQEKQQQEEEKVQAMGLPRRYATSYHQVQKALEQLPVSDDVSRDSSLQKTLEERLVRQTVEKLPRNDGNYLVDMSDEAAAHARSEDSAERVLDARRKRAADRQSKVGSDRAAADLRTPTPLLKTDVTPADVAQEEMRTLKEAYESYAGRLVEDKRRLAQERLLLKQQREMASMAQEIASLKQKEEKEEATSAFAHAAAERHDEAAARARSHSRDRSTASAQRAQHAGGGRELAPFTPEVETSRQDAAVDAAGEGDGAAREHDTRDAFATDPRELLSNRDREREERERVVSDRGASEPPATRERAVAAEGGAGKEVMVPLSEAEEMEKEVAREAAKEVVQLLTKQRREERERKGREEEAARRKGARGGGGGSRSEGGGLVEGTPEAEERERREAKRFLEEEEASAERRERERRREREAEGGDMDDADARAPKGELAHALRAARGKAQSEHSEHKRMHTAVRSPQRAHVVHAVPVKTVIAEEVEAAVDGGGAGNGGHPMLRAVATPLVVAQALSDKRREVGKEELHKQELHTEEEERERAHAAQRSRDEQRDAAGVKRLESRQTSLKREWKHLEDAAGSGSPLHDARARKALSEGAQMLPVPREQLRSLPRSLAPLSQAAYKRQADLRDDVVGTQWPPSASDGASEGAPSKEAARARMRERAHSSASEGARVGHFAGGVAAAAAAVDGKDAFGKPLEKVDVAFKYLGHTNGGPSAAFARTLGSHGTRAVDSQEIPKAKLDLSGTSPYWASAIPSDMPQKQEELAGEDKLNEVPPLLRKSFRQRMEALVLGTAAARTKSPDAGSLRELAQGLAKSFASRSAATHARHAAAPASEQASGIARTGGVHALQTHAGAEHAATEAVEAAAQDPLNANDRINQYMTSRVVSKESSFKDFEKTLHYDPNAF